MTNDDPTNESNVDEQAAHQTDASNSQVGDRDATGTARRAEKADGRQPEPDHLGAAERAFEESRGMERRSGS